MSEQRVSERLSELHEAGVSPVLAIKALVEEFGIGLGQAKEALHLHPDWSDHASSAENLHAEIEATLNKAEAHRQTEAM